LLNVSPEGGEDFGSARPSKGLRQADPSRLWLDVAEPAVDLGIPNANILIRGGRNVHKKHSRYRQITRCVREPSARERWIRGYLDRRRIIPKTQIRGIDHMGRHARQHMKNRAISHGYEHPLCAEIEDRPVAVFMCGLASAFLYLRQGAGNRVFHQGTRYC
jgi:hypothetical protein